ncbi:helix-turn-helix domain-containing protein [Brevundimonas goettingensis]|jgi:HTH-type transcriptional regulator/antitoxin HipB|uniref:Helix-turn-helix domain-containing protein n=1 Tax=Brevundimonas goettingensis TaxID=2774190 RepID=A0A975GZ05_9CAUL|nr:helix-turn-helix domain-containing protein [Brevundimonas goettingensis]QTC92155.1 helix-turn-helix domain-containing protein [Brevundimonas goettingensis]
MEPIVRSEKQLAAAIRRFRRLADMTQGDLATKASKRQATISNLESGSGTLETLFAALGALELEIVVRRRSRGRAPDMGDLF